MNRVPQIVNNIRHTCSKRVTISRRSTNKAGSQKVVRTRRTVTIIQGVLFNTVWQDLLR